MKDRHVVMCPRCGYFARHLTPLNAIKEIGNHPMPTVMTEDQYDADVDRMYAEVEETVGA